MLNIGEKIKLLRKQQDVTQEKLAAYLNISYQAVSKWENGTAYPDITLVPSIANFFGVSSDELLGMRKCDENDELKEYESVYHENNRLGKVFDNIVLSREVLKKYPRNYQWMLNLAYPLMQYNDTDEHQKYSREHKFLEEAVAICERILEDCTVDSIRHSAIQILCYNYPHFGKKDEAVKLANEMPDFAICRGELLFHIYDGEEKIKCGQENLLSMIDISAGLLHCMAFDRQTSKGLSVRDKIKFLETANTLFRAVLQEDEDGLFYNCRLSWNYRKLAELYSTLNEKEKAMQYLLLAERSAKMYDSSLDLGEQKYKSIFANRCTFNPKSVGKNWQGTECELLYKQTLERGFDNLRKLHEFIELQQRLNKMS